MQKEVYEYISKQTNDPIIERRKCKISWEDFAIFQSDIDFLDKLSPVIWSKKYNIPLPKLDPYQRNKRRLAYRNDSKIYRRNCDLTWKSFISMYSPDKKLKVYHHDFWFSDQWDALDYGCDFDFNKSFFDQFHILSLQVPRLGMQLKNCENCDYCCVVVNWKNCYLSNVCSWSEEMYYSTWTTHSKKSIDCFRCYQIEDSYECVLCNNSQKLKYCLMTNNSFNCLFCTNLDWCESCFMSYNLVNKKYCIRNKQYTKEEYQNFIKHIDFCDINQFDKLYIEYQNNIQNKVIYKMNYNTNSEDVFGSFLTKSKNCIVSFDLVTWENCKYYFDAWSNEKDCLDCSYGWDIQRSYECLSSGTTWFHNLFCTFCRNCSNMIYCDICMDSNNCFWCIWLCNKQYCIFNKQYTKKEYEKLVPQIIEHMKKTLERWEFFPISHSPFAYNETVAMEYYPISAQDAKNNSYSWQEKEYPVNIPSNFDKILSKDIPYNINEIKDSILNKVLVCELSWKPYRIISSELEFYRTHNLPIPHLHQDVRQQKRIVQRPWRNLYLRKCDHCNLESISVYPKNTKFKVFCENCYNQEFYW